MADEDKLNQAYYEPYRLWTGNKAIKELHKITPMSKNYQIRVIKTSTWTSSYTTSKRNTSS